MCFQGVHCVAAVSLPSAARPWPHAAVQCRPRLCAAQESQHRHRCCGAPGAPFLATDHFSITQITAWAEAMMPADALQGTSTCATRAARRRRRRPRRHGRASRLSVGRRPKAHLAAMQPPCTTMPELERRGRRRVSLGSRLVRPASRGRLHCKPCKVPHACAAVARYSVLAFANVAHDTGRSQQKLL